MMYVLSENIKTIDFFFSMKFSSFFSFEKKNLYIAWAIFHDIRFYDISKSVPFDSVSIINF